MTTQNSNLAIVNANEVSKSQTNNASAEPKGLAYVREHKSDLVGSLEDLQKLLKSNYLQAEKKHTQFNGRLITLRSSVSDKTLRELLNSTEFKVATRAYLPHVEVCEFANGKVEKRHIVLAKQVRLTADNSDKVTKLDDEIIKEFATSIGKSAKITLTGYKHSVEDAFVPCTNYTDLKHDVACDVVCTQEYTAADGSKVTAPIYIVDEDGNRKPKTEVKNVSFYPVLDETVSPKSFINAVNKALADMWIMLFPSEEGNEQPAEAAK